MPPVFREVQGPLDELRSRIPGLSKDLLPRRDIFGQPIVREGALGPDIASPIYISREKDDPAVQELIKLHIFPSSLSKKVSGIELTPEEYDRLQVAAGAALRQRLDALVSVDGWSQLPEFARREAVQKAINGSRAQARKSILLNPDFLKRKLDAMQQELNRKLGQAAQ